MKALNRKPAPGQVAKWAIAAAVIAGTLAISGIADVAEGSGLMARLFILFLGAIIAVQIIPGVMLLGAMVKGVAALFNKKAKVTVRR